VAKVEWTDASSDLEIQLHLALRGLGLVVETRDDSNGSLPSPDKFGVGVDLVIANNHEDWHEENDERRHHEVGPAFPASFLACGCGRCTRSRSHSAPERSPVDGANQGSLQSLADRRRPGSPGRGRGAGTLRRARTVPATRGPIAEPFP